MTAPTIAVCGFGRCGSSMLMQMLAAGGIPMAPGSQQGSGEMHSIDLIAGLNPAAVAGTAIKLLDFPLRFPIPTGPTWRFVWLDRDHVQQATSTIKLLTGIGAIEPMDSLTTQWKLRELVGSYQRDRARVLGTIRSAGPTVVLSYEQVLARPTRAVRHLRRIAPDIDGVAAAAVVHRRDGTCRPDLAVEMGHVGGAS